MSRQSCALMPFVPQGVSGCPRAKQHRPRVILPSYLLLMMPKLHPTLPWRVLTHVAGTLVYKSLEPMMSRITPPLWTIMPVSRSPVSSECMRRCVVAAAHEGGWEGGQPYVYMGHARSCHGGRLGMQQAYKLHNSLVSDACWWWTGVLVAPHASPPTAWTFRGQ